MVTIIGSINLDLIAVVDRLPAPGETVSGDDLQSAPGGKGANQALAAARAGAAARMVGAVGRDAYAAPALSLLKEGGVDLTDVDESDRATGVALILVDAQGENVIAVTAGANAALAPERVQSLAIAPGEHVLLQFEIPLASVRAALLAARGAGAVTLLNTAPYRKGAAELLGLADFVISNETEFDLCAEALALPGARREERMRAFAAQTGRGIVVTLGGDGVVAAVGDGWFSVPALAVTPVDTVGAGDTFCGYLGAGLAAGLPLEQALRRAATAGSLACLKPGAQPAIPTAAEVDEALA
ncbi:MAG: ribokinase [Rhizobiaceae bacterium]|nr:ribokinase [Rhizobiaceae bacterium]